MSNANNIFGSGLIQRYLREMDRLITRLLAVSASPTPQQLEFYKEFDAHVVSTNDQKIPLHHFTENRNSSFSLPTEHYNTAQQHMLELAQKFNEFGFQYRVEQPDVFLPFANLPAVQSLQYLTPDNYAQQVRDILHGLFRRLLPGSKFRVRGNGVLLKLNGNMIKRAYTFNSFMEQEDFWTNFLNESYPFISSSTQDFHTSKRELMDYNFNFFTVRNENTQEEGQSEVIHIYIPLPKPDHVPSESIDTPEGRVFYVHPDLIKDLNNLIMLLTRISTSATVLANAYPLFNRHMRKHCEELNEAQRSQHRLAMDAFLQEIALRQHVFTAEQIADFPEELHKALGLTDTEEEQTVFLPFTNRGFINLFPHHIYIKDTTDPMNKDWSPIPPISFSDELDTFNFGGETYLYKGIALQTGYSDTSPRSGNGTSPLVFGELVYTALHESMYNELLINSLEQLNLTEAQKHCIKTSCRIMSEQDNVSDHLAHLVEQALFTESEQTVPSYFSEIKPDLEEANSDEPSADETEDESVDEEPLSFQADFSQFFQNSDDSATEESEANTASDASSIELKRLVITKQPSANVQNRATFTFTQPYTMNGNSEQVYTTEIQLNMSDATLSDAFIRFRLYLREESQAATGTDRRELLQVMSHAYAQPDLRYITTDSLEIGETAVV